MSLYYQISLLHCTILDLLCYNSTISYQVQYRSKRASMFKKGGSSEEGRSPAKDINHEFSFEKNRDVEHARIWVISSSTSGSAKTVGPSFIISFHQIENLCMLMMMFLRPYSVTQLTIALICILFWTSDAQTDDELSFITTDPSRSPSVPPLTTPTASPTRRPTPYPTKSPSIAPIASPTQSLGPVPATCDDTPEYITECDAFALNCDGLAAIHCCRCRSDCCGTCGRSDTLKNPCSAAIINNSDKNKDDDGPNVVLPSVVSAIAALAVLGAAFLFFQKRKDNRELVLARRAMIERRRRRLQEIDQLYANGEELPPTPAEEQERHSKILTCLKKITAENPEDLDGQNNRRGSGFFNRRKEASKHECCICLESYVPNESICVPIAEGCKHLFHEECIVEWLKTHNDCPLCRIRLLSD